MKLNGDYVEFFLKFFHYIITVDIYFLIFSSIQFVVKYYLLTVLNANHKLIGSI